MNELIDKVLKWSVDKGITGPEGKGTKIAQAAKVLEEARETYNAVQAGDLHETKDGVGDTSVTLIILCKMYGWGIEDIIGDGFFRSKTDKDSEGIHEIAYRIILNSNLVQTSVVFEDPDVLKEAIRKTMLELRALASAFDWTLNECLQAAYDVISKRSGTMIEGSFVKMNIADEIQREERAERHAELKAEMPDQMRDPDYDFDEPLGTACQLGDTNCESCS